MDMTDDQITSRDRTIEHLTRLRDLHQQRITDLKTTLDKALKLISEQDKKIYDLTYPKT